MGTPPRRSPRNMPNTSTPGNEVAASSTGIKSTSNTYATAAKSSGTTTAAMSSSSASVAAPSQHQLSTPQVSLVHNLHIPSATTTKTPRIELLNNPAQPNSVQRNLPAQQTRKAHVESNACSTNGSSVAGKSLALSAVPPAEVPAAIPGSASPTVQSHSVESMLICMQNQIEILQRQLKEAEVRLPNSELGKDRELTTRQNNVFSAAPVTQIIESCAMPTTTISSQANTVAHIQQHDSNMSPNALQQNMFTQPVYTHPTTFAPCLNNRASPYASSPNPYSVDSAIQLQRAANNQIHVFGSTTAHRKLIDLPQFSGQPEDWPIFYTAYVESTSAYGYSHFENNQRLYKCLKGEARDVVKSFLIHPNNINAAVEHLRTRFGRPESLIRSQLKQIREISPISENNVGKLMQFATTTKNLAIFLNSINGEQHLANPTLLEELVGKLPMSKKIEWARRAATISPYPNIQHFSDWLSEIAALISVVLDNEPREPRRRPVFHVAEIQRNNVTSTLKCSVCSAKHKPFECKRFLDASIADRWSIVKRHRLFFSCLNYGHSTRDCHKRKPCAINGCGRKHNKLLHEQQNVNTCDTGSLTTNGTTQTSNSTNEAVLSCKANNNPRNKLLFRVVAVTLHGPAKSIDVYALLDEGSSVTMADRDVLEELGVSGQRKQLDIQWFGGRTIQEPTVLVDLYVNGRGLRKRHKLRNIHGVNNLNLPTQTLSEKDLQNLKLDSKFTPSFYSNVKPKLLIGLDHCHLG
ncbi:PREDICTED: uncharacterized protein LOC108363101 [Rhagoletis zephyria]|uniref:uncharacterized protein LOC108363101 n=1 Tax=Rhagoletis zephyria TaxID=28612 RepID=UPI0008118686|nr:PREDICTED: uncharacterized protein LOC108363101 [Rhagoletis zephyria]